MKECKSSCGHHRLVMEYRVAREAHVVAIEAETNGDEKMARECGLRAVTFREWLEGLRSLPSDSSAERC